MITAHPEPILLRFVPKEKSVSWAVLQGGAFDAPYVQLTTYGQIARKYIESGNSISGITVDKYVIMPNHIHMILIVAETAASKASPANAAVPHFISTFKRFVHRDADVKIFQRSYHDHVIRSEQDYQKIWEYIDHNPARWSKDCFYSENA